MDIRLLAAVMSRYKKIAIAGLAAAVVLAGLAYMRAGGTPAWEAQSEVLLTQSNDPYGGPTAAVVQEGGYLSGLATVYAAIANGDPLQAMARHAAGVHKGTVEAAEVVDPSTGNVEPLITLTSSAASATDAVKLAEKMPTVLQNDISREQESANVPRPQRVELAQVKNGLKPELASSTSITVPLLVFMGIAGGVITLIFMLENLNPKTAEKLGRVSRPAEGPIGELATVLTALVQTLQPAPSAAPIYPATRNGHGGASHGPVVNGHSATGSQTGAGAAGPVQLEDVGASAATGDAEPWSLVEYAEAIRPSNGEDLSPGATRPGAVDLSYAAPRPVARDRPSR